MAARRLRPRERDAPPAMREWVVSRPASVQALIAEFPPGCVITDDHDDDWYVLGYTEDDRLIIVPFWPWPGEDRYDHALRNKQYAHAAHLRDGSVRVKRQA
jgi:hypothetical protein